MASQVGRQDEQEPFPGASSGLAGRSGIGVTIIRVAVDRPNYPFVGVSIDCGTCHRDEGSVDQLSKGGLARCGQLRAGEDAEGRR